MVKEGWMVIVNPKAGSGKGLKDWPVISNTMNRYGLDFTCVFTEHKYHAVELTVKSIKDGYRKLVAIGGDGTIHEIVNGIFIQNIVPTTDILLSVIPSGTGNDWVRMYGITQTYRDAVQSMVDEKYAFQDVAKVEFYESKVKQHRFMANVGGMGFDAEVTKEYNKLKDNGKSGRNMYLLSVLRVFFFHISHRFKIFTDGKLFFEGLLFSSSVGIGKYNGGGMVQMPEAETDDGLLDITAIKNINKFVILRDFKKLYSGRIFENKGVIHTKAKIIEIDSQPQSRIEIDGEIMGYSPFKFELIPQSIRVVVGPKFGVRE